MTAPVIHGYPDFGRYSATADKYIVNAVASFTAGLHVVGTFFVGDQRYLGLFLSTATNNCQFRFDFYADSGTTQLFSGRQVDLNVGDIFEGAIPVLGPWVRVSVFAVASNADVAIQGWGQAVYSHQASGAAATNVLFSFQGNLAAGTTTVDGNRVMPGPALLFAELTVANLIVTLNAVDTNGAVVLLGRVRNPNSPNPCPVYLPARHLQIVAQNNTAGAAFFSYVLTADPGLRQ